VEANDAKSREIEKASFKLQKVGHDVIFGAWSRTPILFGTLFFSSSLDTHTHTHLPVSTRVSLISDE